MKSAGKARSNGLYRHIRTSKEIIRNLLNYFIKHKTQVCRSPPLSIIKKIDKEKSVMKSGNKSIRINGKSVEVTDEVYKVYGDNKYHSASGVYFCSS